MGRPLDRSENKLPAVLRDIRKGRQVCDWLGKLLQRDGADPFVLKKFYHAVVQAVLIFGVETLVLLPAMSKTQVHTYGFSMAGDGGEGKKEK